MTDQNGSKVDVSGLNCAKFREAFIPYYTHRKEIHEKHFAERTRNGPDYLGVESWSPEEQDWVRMEKAKLDKLAEQLGVTSEQRGKIQNDAIQEVDSGTRKQKHP